ncbi:hypothetical protein KIPB_006191 [Kipferlia bialata]|uniref:Uncharacterized protein n=1 Tax=Kipferlia bialata TaxID=797122 RepID=A0A9K3CZA1_9EUKA|nr:hypothetical protein KIPB_006191 [Kipferlia bialata]|eukprot:g6191.t1
MCEYVIFEAQRSNGKYNKYIKDWYPEAKGVVMSRIDYYISIDQKIDAAQQIQATINSLHIDRALTANTFFWIDVQNGQHWGSNTAANVQFIEDMVNAGNTAMAGLFSGAGANFGIQTSKSMWKRITGDNRDAFFGGLRLWYVDWTGNGDMSDFKRFGPWYQPSLKQYQGNVGMCFTHVNYDSY